MSPMSPRLLRPRAPGTFSPKNLSGLVGWWDANVTSSLAQASNGTTAVSATDDPVAYWGDLSGNGRNLTQSTNNNRPLYKPGTLNGRPTLSFDGVNDTLGASFTLAQPHQHFAVFRFNAAYVSGNPRAWDGFGTSGGFYRASATSMVLNYGGSDDSAVVTDAEMQTFGIWETEASGTSSFIRRAGVRRDSASSNIGANSPSGIRLAVFNNGFSAPGNVSFAEILIYSRILSASEATSVRAYLGNKYNLAYA
jgi:hypothetical protein